MVRITVELIRKKSEHNEGEISTLEEISLHQENIEKIELIDRLCRHLTILLLQNNLIAKIENLNMLKKLEYLNLALNNIEVIENLEGLESLEKLDLTLNFIGDLRSIKSLRHNENLRQLFLTGNPCADYSGYRDYVIATLPQLKELDMTEITRSERITALQRHAEIEGDVIRDYRSYAKLRAKQIHHHRQQEEFKNRKANNDNGNHQHNNDNETENHHNNDNESDGYDNEQENEQFWNTKSYHTPEERIAIAERSQKIMEKRNQTHHDQPHKTKYIPKLFSPEGLPYNLNQPKVPFVLNDEDDGENIYLDVTIYKHLDSSLLEVDIQPSYIRVTIKGKILQLRLPCEVLTDKSFARRNVITGNLIITMPRLDPLPTIAKPPNYSDKKSLKDNKSQIVRSGVLSTKRELLEIGPPKDDMDFSKIYQDPKKSHIISHVNKTHNEVVTDNYVDNPEVPPLE
ncbi:protein tilB homolog [Chelonus insularis]|uniref:protein tilB homolog n=1 Tax=Chelonus insularis TaxID=460826 RepID=UPI00158B6472|nr:protein tilB homolog [Chelonus insularis]